MNLDSAVFYVKDLNKSIEFFQGILGLEIEFQQGDNFVNFLFDNGVRLGLKKAAEQREIPGSQTIFVKTADAESDLNKFQVMGLPTSELVEFDWGKIFSVYDPDGNRIEFAERQ